MTRHRLAEHDTTWREELDGARQRRAERSSDRPGAGLARLARQMGYASPRSARRALSRWDSGPGQAVATRPPGPPGSCS